MEAPSIVVSSSGLATACLTASSALSSPLACPIPMCAIPLSFITVCTSAKSRLISAGQIDQVCDTLNCLLQHLICLLQCLRHCRPAVYDLKQLVIRDDDQRVNILLPDARCLPAHYSCVYGPRSGMASSQRRQSECPSPLQSLPRPELHRYRYLRPYHR